MKLTESIENLIRDWRIYANNMECSRFYDSETSKNAQYQIPLLKDLKNKLESVLYNAAPDRCPDIPLFGSDEPDAHCISGYLWDLTNLKDGEITGGKIPCPICNRDKFIEYDPFEIENTFDELVQKGEIKKEYSKELTLQWYYDWIYKIKTKYNRVKK